MKRAILSVVVVLLVAWGFAVATDARARGAKGDDCGICRAVGRHVPCRCCPAECCSSGSDKCCCLHVDRCTCVPPPTEPTTGDAGPLIAPSGGVDESRLASPSGDRPVRAAWDEVKGSEPRPAHQDEEAR